MTSLSLKEIRAKVEALEKEIRLQRSIFEVIQNLSLSSTEKEIF